MKAEHRKPRLAIIGGPDIGARRDLVGLLGRDFDVTVIGSIVLADTFFGNGISYRPYRLQRTVNPVSDVLTIIELMGVLRHLRPDVVHAYDTKPSVLGRLAAHWAGAPVIVGTVPGIGSLYVDNRPSTRIIRYFYEQMQRYACRLSDVTVFQNDDDLQQFVIAGLVSQERTTMIRGSGVDSSAYRPNLLSLTQRAAIKYELAIPPQAAVVTMVSRVIRSKGVCDFARAAEILTSRGGDASVRFLLVGELDRLSRDALNPAEWNAVQRSVNYLGRRPDVAAILAITDIFALPSYYREGIPRALLEAAASGNALITTNFPGCRDVVQHDRSGLLVPPREPDRLADAIAELLADPVRRQRLGAAARDLVIHKFDLPIVADSLGRVYRELLSQRRPPSNDREADATRH